MSGYGYYLPLRPWFGQRFEGSVKLPAEKNDCQGISVSSASFFSFPECDETVRWFVDALSESRPDDARVYISKNFAGDFDMDELTRFFGGVRRYKSLIKAGFEKEPKNCRTDSILLLGGDERRNLLVHLHMIKEPDCFGNWKIYGIEREG